MRYRAYHKQYFLTSMAAYSLHHAYTDFVWVSENEVNTNAVIWEQKKHYTTKIFVLLKNWYMTGILKVKKWTDHYLHQKKLIFGTK